MASWEWKISSFCILRIGCAALRCHWYLSNVCLYWLFFSVAFVDGAYNTNNTVSRTAGTGLLCLFY